MFNNMYDRVLFMQIHSGCLYGNVFNKLFFELLQRLTKDLL